MELKFRDGKYFSPNLLGRLLMQLRDSSWLEYKLTDDLLGFCLLTFCY